MPGRAGQLSAAIRQTVSPLHASGRSQHSNLQTHTVVRGLGLQSHAATEQTDLFLPSHPIQVAVLIVPILQIKNCSLERSRGLSEVT